MVYTLPLRRIYTCPSRRTLNFENYIETPNHTLVTSQNEDMGSVVITQEPSCDDNKSVFKAVANKGYHFVQWNDGNTDNPRTVQVLGDATYSAVFEKNTYTITAQSANDIQGYVSAPSQAEYLDQVSLTAFPNVGYHFTQWSDGNTDTPRTIVLTCSVSRNSQWL